MKAILFAVIFFVSNLSAQQYYYTFSELNGIEDNSGNTHLFYRLNTFQKGGGIIGDYIENSIYHFELENETDTLFLFDGGRIGDGVNSIVDLEFWNNNSDQYITLEVGCGIDCDSYIRRFDEEAPSITILGSGTGVEISEQNDSILFASLGELIKSTDGGRNWTDINSTLSYIQSLSISPFNENILLAYANAGLYKSTDGGINFFIVDTSTNIAAEILYDKDSTHIYSILENNLRVSDNNGNAYTWVERYASANKIYLSVDYSQSGSIYLADGRYIFQSTDYGLTFNEFKILDRKITGIYKKPASEKLYAATKYNLWEITPDSGKVIKSLEPDPALAEFYPLAIGNKWVYEHTVCNWDVFPADCDFYKEIVEVIGDTVLPNGKNYFIVRKTNACEILIYFERYDESDATVSRYTEDNSFINNEYIIEDLASEVGDTLCTNRFNLSFNCSIANIFIEETSVNLFNDVFQKKKYQVQDLSWHEYSLVRGFGIDSITYGFDFGYGYKKLNGCLIDGVLFGDTTILAVENEEEIIKEYYLSQNYPNPFNPATKIKYTIPAVGTSFMKFPRVTLKIYDILGREIATLVNEEKQPGTYEVEFNPASVNRNLASGIYFYKLQTGNYSSTMKMIYLK